MLLLEATQSTTNVQKPPPPTHTSGGGKAGDDVAHVLWVVLDAVPGSVQAAQQVEKTQLDFQHFRFPERAGVGDLQHFAVVHLLVLVEKTPHSVEQSC